MSSIRLYREYRFKLYLNMNHFITINGNPGQIHPHTWEFVFSTIVGGDDFVQFSTIERTIEKYLQQYQNKVLNEIPPFDVTNPTIENVTDLFSDEIRVIVRDVGCELISVEGSETPTRSYIVDYKHDDGFMRRLNDIRKDRISTVIDTIVDHMSEDMKNNR